MALNNTLIFKRIIEVLFIILPITLIFSNILTEIILVIFILIYFLNIKIKIFFKYLKNPIIALLFIFWLYLILNYLINLDNDPSLLRSIFFIRFPLFVLAICFFINEFNLNINKILKYWMYILTIVCIDLIFQFFTLKNFFGYQAILHGNIYRLGGFMDDELKISNLIFHFGSLVFAYFFSKQYSNNKKINYRIMLFQLLTIISIFLTAERANFITILSFTILFIILISANNKKFFAIMTIVLSVLISIPLISESNLSNRMTNDLVKKIELFKVEPDKSYLNKTNPYFAHYSAAYQLFERNIFFGVGLKNFRNFCHDETLNNDIDPIFHTKKCATHPHSFYFEILSEIGIIGLSLLLCLFILLFYNVLKIFLKTKNYFLVLNSFIIFVYFIPFLPRGSFFTNWNAIIFWTIFAFLFANYFKLSKSND